MPLAYCEIFPEKTLWIEARWLKQDNVVFMGKEQKRVNISEIRNIETTEEIYNLEMEEIHSFLPKPAWFITMVPALQSMKLGNRASTVAEKIFPPFTGEIKGGNIIYRNEFNTWL